MPFLDFQDFKPEQLKEQRKWLEDNWSFFLESPDSPLSVRTVVQESWKRCLELGVNPLKLQSDACLDDDELQELVQTSQLYEFALPVLQEMSSHAKSTGHLLTLSDCHGRIMYLDGDPFVMKQAEAMNFTVGADWSEQAIGTNAIGTCLALQRPVQIFASEHFCSGVHDWVCSAAPVRDPVTREVVGIIDATGRWERAQSHTAGFVAAASRSIGERLYVHSMKCRMELMQRYFHICSRYPADGVIAMDTRCQLVAANPTAEQLAMARRGLPLHLAWDAIKMYDEILQQSGCKDGELSTVQLKSLDLIASLETVFYANRRIGFVLIVSLQPPDSSHTQTGTMGSDNRFKRVTVVGHQTRRYRRTGRCTHFAAGESGVGKELFANSIHESSSRRTKPFVAINCGAIPKELIASEFFGYEPGTFTGGSRTGRKGKFEEANGGTLFLDEIGEMPLDAQVYLLRVLQEREVVRLGGARPIPVDVRIIAATNRSLEQQVQEGSFRLDLFYRLNVVTLRIPTLRDRREDIPTLIRHALQMLSQKHGKVIHSIDPTVLNYLCHEYRWPGNVRELWNVMEHAVLFCTGGTITWAELPLPSLSHERTVPANHARGGCRLQNPRPSPNTGCR
ncbi:sigma-54-dependent Fis family transcriptional regulator [Alicyclobacillus contaminans]|nr:sigma-54-dependent Fis family transcriptional regulator [Alicyclobacillus contaminans]